MQRRIGPAILIIVAVLALGVGSSASSQPLPNAPACPIFPGTNVWNKPVDSLPVAANSDKLIKSIGLSAGLHPDFGSGLWDGGPIGIPITVVPGDQKRVPVSFDYASQSDPGPYPIPKNVAIEGGPSSTGDRHAIIVDKDHCTLFELYALYPRSDGSWHAGSGAIWSLISNALRPAGWTSADAAGLPILPGLARYSDVAKGVIDHALRFTAPQTRRAYIYPARHYASDSTSTSLPPMGTRVRLEAGYDVSGFPKQARIILVALKRYGMMLADNGSAWYISGAPNANWNNDALHTLGRVKGSDLEVVDTSSLRNG